MAHSFEIAINWLAFCGEIWFLTAGSVVSIPMILACSDYGSRELCEDGRNSSMLLIGYCSTKFSLKSVNQSGMSANDQFQTSRHRFRKLVHYDNLILKIQTNEKQLRFQRLVMHSSSSDSCDGVVEDELLPVLVVNPGTTGGTKLSDLQIIVFPCLSFVALDR